MADDFSVRRSFCKRCDKKLACAHGSIDLYRVHLKIALFYGYVPLGTSQSVINSDYFIDYPEKIKILVKLLAISLCWLLF
jgi:hypothetical protein